MRKKTKRLIIIFFILIILILIIAAFFYYSQPEPYNGNVVAETNKTQSNKTIIVGSFNIQIFGESKREKEDVMDILTNIACNFDVLAIQELRDDTETTAEIYVDAINGLCENSTYDFIMSPRLGRSSSKENYAIIYKTNNIQYIEDSAYVYEDTNDDFEREPLVAQFKSGSFDFVMINNHIKPEDAENEIAVLDEVVNDARTHFEGEEDYIILGDLNADCTYLDEDNIPLDEETYIQLIPNDEDTTTKSTDCTYDRIIVTKETMEDYVGKYRIFRFDEEYELDSELTVDVSDHYPIMVEFYTNKDTN